MAGDVIPRWYFVYIVCCSNGTFYVGSTNNIERRVAEHNAGRGGQYTRTNRPVTLEAAWEFPSRAAALRAEHELKRLSHDEKRMRAEQQTGLVLTAQMKKEPHRPVRQIVCQICGRHTRTRCQSRDICQSCHKRETTTNCQRCGRATHLAETETGLCPQCVKTLARPIASCTRCTHVRPIYDEQAGMCQACSATSRKLTRKRAASRKVPCSVCGELRVSGLSSHPICRRCYVAECNGWAICARCHQLKPVEAKSVGLCKQCNKDRLAPGSLRKYVDSYDSPYVYNVTLFHILADTISWDKVDQHLESRFRRFGKFLQATPLPRPLTWKTIDEALPSLPQTNRNEPKQIRASLLDLGHRMAALGMLDPWEMYRDRRNAVLPISKAPLYMHPVLDRFAEWLWERKCRPHTVRQYCDWLSAFWLWCEKRGVHHPGEVQTALVNDYLLTLRWQWTCGACGALAPFDTGSRTIRKVCAQCGASGTMGKTERFVYNTMRTNRVRLRVFFDWAKLVHLCLINPVDQRDQLPKPSIQHYPPEFVERLLEYAASADSDPVAALMLYLVLLHGLTEWELRHAQLPNLVPFGSDALKSGLADTYSMIVPRREPSVGDSSPGRPGRSELLEFHESVAPWLKPLLERFEQDRRTKTKNPSIRYIFVSPTRGRHNMPVGPVYIWTVIRQVSLDVLGVACNPQLLRQTAAVYVTDHSGPGMLPWMGWREQRAFVYSWAPRTLVYPQTPPSVSSLDDEDALTGSDHFPSPSAEAGSPGD